MDESLRTKQFGKITIVSLSYVTMVVAQTYKVKTFWDDVHTPGYEKTASDLAKLVKEAGIGDIFIQDVNEFHGCDHNVQLLPDGTTRTHLYVTIPNKFKFNKRVHHFDSAAGYRGELVSLNVLFPSLN